MYLGLDLSLAGTGVVIIDGSCTILLKAKLKPPDGCIGVDRLFFLHEILKEILTSNDIVFSCIEGPAYGRGDGGRLFELGEWAGIAKLLLFTANIPFILAVPSQLKKYVCGSGKGATKDLIILDVYKKFGEEIRDNDIADAYVLSRIAKDFYSVLKEKDVEVLKYQQEVLNALVKRYGLDQNALLG